MNVIKLISCGPGISALSAGFPKPVTHLSHQVAFSDSGTSNKENSVSSVLCFQMPDGNR